jgi:hypothetical protein
MRGLGALALFTALLGSDALAQNASCERTPGVARHASVDRSIGPAAHDGLIAGALLADCRLPPVRAGRAQSPRRARHQFIRADSVPADTLAAVQSNDGFNTLEDGQPGTPGTWEALIQPGWSQQLDSPDEWNLELQFQHTFAATPFLRNLQLSLGLAFATTAGAVTAGDLVAAWQQRWIADSARMLSLATLLEMDLPTAAGSTDVVTTLTGIVVKTFGFGNVYLNGYAQADSGPQIELWGYRLGYGLRIGSASGVIGDYVRQRERDVPVSNTFELSAFWAATDWISLGPGISVTREAGSGSSQWGAGVNITLSM